VLNPTISRERPAPSGPWQAAHAESQTWAPVRDGASAAVTGRVSATETPIAVMARPVRQEVERSRAGSFTAECGERTPGT
jgi:hypothetical protein